jgi:hypothetical protein
MFVTPNLKHCTDLYCTGRNAAVNSKNLEIMVPIKVANLLLNDVRRVDAKISTSK